MQACGRAYKIRPEELSSGRRECQHRGGRRAGRSFSSCLKISVSSDRPKTADKPEIPETAPACKLTSGVNFRRSRMQKGPLLHKQNANLLAGKPECHFAE